MTKAAFGTVSVLAAGTLQLTLPDQCRFWYLQNQEVTPLKVTFISPDWGAMTSIILNPALADGEGGGYMDSVGFPYFSPQGVTLTSATAAARFGSGASPQTPDNVFPYPGQGPSLFGR